MARWRVGWRSGCGGAAGNDLGPFVAISGVLTGADVPPLCSVIGALRRLSSTAVFGCDLGEVTNGDLRAVDALARLQLCASRNGGRLRLWKLPVPLRDVLDLAGASEWLAPPGCDCGGSLEPASDRRG